MIFLALLFQYFLNTSLIIQSLCHKSDQLDFCKFGILRIWHANLLTGCVTKRQQKQAEFGNSKP